MILVAALLAAGLLLLYLTRPYYRPIALSAAQFFVRRDTREASRRFSLRSLITSRAFWLQITVFLAVLAALVLLENAVAGAEVQQLGIWLIIDTSASMTTLTNDGDRMASVRRETDALADYLMALPDNTTACTRLFAFDLSLRAIADGLAPTDLSDAVSSLTPRALGTDVGLLHLAFGQATDTLAQPIEPGQCLPTHLVVITDQPAQDALFEEAPLPLLWRSVAQPADNYGLIDVYSVGAVEFGAVPGIVLEVGAWGQRAEAQVRITDASGGTVAEERVMFAGRPSRELAIMLPAPGRYTASIEPGGDYALDDQLVFDWSVQPGVRVDWQLADTSIPNALGWQITANQPRLRVRDWGAAAQSSDAPTLFIGAGYGGPPVQIDRFAEAPELLTDLNLDIAERVGIIGSEADTLSGLVPLLIGDDNRVWLAWGDAPRRVFIPGLPQFGADADLEAFSTTLFFNAVRWLLGAENPAPLFERTTPAQPVPEGIRNSIHSGEGDTSLVAASEGVWAEIQAAGTTQVDPLWPLLLAIAALVFAGERLLALVKGASWG